MDDEAELNDAVRRFMVGEDDFHEVDESSLTSAALPAPVIEDRIYERHEVSILGDWLLDVGLVARAGLLAQLKYLVDVRGKSVQMSDVWNASPLFYACLGGHVEVVKYLLSKGARCEVNTYDGIRCFYVANSAEIRSLLKQYKTVSKKHSDYDNLFHNALIASSPLYGGMAAEEADVFFSDVLFSVKDVSFRLHRVVLSARCEYFASMFAGKWRDRSTVVLNRKELNLLAFAALIRYLYTGRIVVSSVDMPGFIALAKQCKLHSLRVFSERVLEWASRHQHDLISYDPNNLDPLSHVAELSRHLPALRSDWSDFVHTHVLSGGEDDAHSTGCFSDFCVRVQDASFPCHRLFLCKRSEYFAALSNFQLRQSGGLGSGGGGGGGREGAADAHSGGGASEAAVTDVDPRLFATAVEFVYSNRIIAARGGAEEEQWEEEEQGEVLEWSHEEGGQDLFDLLHVAHLLLLDDLKQYCMGHLQNLIRPENVFVVYDAATTMGLTKLEEACVMNIFLHFDQLADTDEFKEAVRRSASLIKDRQETDSIPLVDELRTAIASSSPLHAALAQSHLKRLDELLESLGLEC